MNRSLNLKIKYFLPKKKKILSFFTHLPLLLTLLTLFPFLLALLSLSSNLCTYSLFLIILFTLFPSLLILLIHSLYHILLALFYSPFIALYSHFIPPSCLCTLSLSIFISAWSAYSHNSYFFTLPPSLLSLRVSITSFLSFFFFSLTLSLFTFFSYLPSILLNSPYSLFIVFTHSLYHYLLSFLNLLILGLLRKKLTLIPSPIVNSFVSLYSPFLYDLLSLLTLFAISLSLTSICSLFI
ncbi:unnamed protein product [Acanthosepion pharaonis]|uniref:Uncharacterized protein n=1 Tax=Acanthosepion pharaonis TaxID=158019 RepID=A0A812AR80_ACAPH|nr:unnamed protein product [Sepia pharaonis]